MTFLRRVSRPFQVYDLEDRRFQRLEHASRGFPAHVSDSFQILQPSPRLSEFHCESLLHESLDTGLFRADWFVALQRILPDVPPDLPVACAFSGQIAKRGARSELEQTGRAHPGGEQNPRERERERERAQTERERALERKRERESTDSLSWSWCFAYARREFARARYRFLACHGILLISDIPESLRESRRHEFRGSSTVASTFKPLHRNQIGLETYRRYEPRIAARRRDATVGFSTRFGRIVSFQRTRARVLWLSSTLSIVHSSLETRRVSFEEKNWVRRSRIRRIERLLRCHTACKYV